jgi:hypothetical protein
MPDRGTAKRLYFDKKNTRRIDGHQNTDEIKRRIERIKEGERDLYILAK